MYVGDRLDRRGAINDLSRFRVAYRCFAGIHVNDWSVSGSPAEQRRSGTRDMVSELKGAQRNRMLHRGRLPSGNASGHDKWIRSDNRW